MNVVKSLCRGASEAFGRGALLASLATVGVLAAAGADQAQSESLGARRQAALGELRQFFNKEMRIEAALTLKKGPELWEESWGKPVYGCPSTSGLDTPERFAFTLNTGGPRAWAGDFDGLNVATRNEAGESGMGVAVPKESLTSNGETHFRFDFDGQFNVRRRVIDEAIEKFDQCARKQPPGDYGADGFAERCKYPSFTKEQVGQTCVESIAGRILNQGVDGTYSVTFDRSYNCDFVQYGRPGPGSTAFVGCYFAKYEGKATLTALDNSSAARDQRRAQNRAQKRCTRAKGNAKKQCVSREMSREMAKK